MSSLIRFTWALPNTVIGLVFVPFVVVTRGHLQVVDGVLELHGWLLSWLLRHCVLLRGGAAAMTLGHVVLGRDSLALMATRRHERVHVRQCEVWGPAFIPAYLVAGLWGLIWRRGAYDGNYFERQAMAHETRAEESCSEVESAVRRVSKCAGELTPELTPERSAR